ncbi:imidazole glycerol phosphate synthase subunit HisF [Hugenholtzia roseola]|uniref:imidazole glycerol phosphate synthase subunit HisF n=1 Tax=Hugenholtzia roseola TaxID=1002 RepID=UPI00047E0FBD|nr:imidazole glycerol phosphate synthase subunit HisF [Hugenholtzia roseola]
MPLSKRIIPCLDIKDGQTVKGVQFEQLRYAGDPVALAARYAEEGADELVFLDITATDEKRKTLADLALRVAQVLPIPFTIGGGVSSVADIEVLLASGADKITINSAAIYNPTLITEAAKRFGEQCIVVAIDAKAESSQVQGATQAYWRVYASGGKKATDLELFSWAKRLEDLGAGELLFTSMTHDGTKNGFADTVYAQLSSLLHIPIIASGGAGKKEDFANVFEKGKADAALAASVFHFGEIPIPTLKNFLQQKGIAVRI